MSLNIFFQGYDSVNGYQSRMLKRIEEQVHFDRCLMTGRDNDGQDVYDPAVYEVVDYDMCANATYAKKVDMNTLLPLDREILTAMAPYEVMATKMLCRITDFDQFTFDEAKRFYLQHLRFWHDAFVRNHISYVFMTGIPHHTHDYVIYGLTKVLQIPMTILAPTHLPNWCFVGNDLYKLYERIDARYAVLSEKREPAQLPDDVETYFNALLRENKKQKDKVMYGESRKKHIESEKKQIMAFIQPKRIRKITLSAWKHGILDSLRAHSLEPLHKRLEKLNKERYWIKKIRLKLKRCDTIGDYEKLAKRPDLTKDPYVIFLFHLTPEATSVPQGGVFCEQELCVQLLAPVLKEYGIRLYIKEHYVQPYRQEHFYEDLAAIDNVTMISSDVDSVDLLEHCVAAATPAGTVAIEAIANGKPALHFGHGGFEHGPGQYPIGNAREIRAAIEDILEKTKQAADGRIVDREDARRFFQAFADTSIRVFSPIECDDADKIQKSADDVVALAIEEIKKAQK
ncbi:MAG: hypothetical protein E7300_09495 [Lachnospiraceae bacterium]|nr:hypothetical protein [Lachnospiraceae bacterium]